MVGKCERLASVLGCSLDSVCDVYVVRSSLIHTGGNPGKRESREELWETLLDKVLLPMRKQRMEK